MARKAEAVGSVGGAIAGAIAGAAKGSSIGICLLYTSDAADD